MSLWRKYYTGIRHASILAFVAAGPLIGLVQAKTPAVSTPTRHGMQMRLAACATCHGKQGQGDMGRAGGAYPRLAGQPARYLYRQMQRFKSEQRRGIPPVTIMHRLLANLPAPYLRLIAGYYHDSSPPYPPRPRRNSAQWRQGRKLARQGLPRADIAPCTHCHGADLEGHPPGTPALAGQYARYLEIQFSHWAQGARHNPLHQHIAKTMSKAQVRAMAAYLASLRPSTSDGK
jgi:cytochrome c553